MIYISVSADNNEVTAWPTSAWQPGALNQLILPITGKANTKQLGALYANAFGPSL
jgi:hypothetical protein